MLRFNFRTSNAIAFFVLILAGCSHDPPLSTRIATTSHRCFGGEFIITLAGGGLDRSSRGHDRSGHALRAREQLVEPRCDQRAHRPFQHDPGGDGQDYESTGGRLQPDFTPDYGIPYAVVDASTPLVPVTFSNAAESDKGAPGQPAGYPIPIAATTDLRYLEEAGRSGSNRHLLLIDRGRRLAFELFNAQFANGNWFAGSGAVFKLDSNYRRPDGWTSADASGLSMTPGLVRYDEVYGSAPIRHALRCSIRQTAGHVWPASHSGSSDPAGLPLGMRFRLEVLVQHLRLPGTATEDFPGHEDLRPDRRRPRRQHVRAGHDGFALGQYGVEPRVPRAPRDRLRRGQAGLGRFDDNLTTTSPTSPTATTTG